MPKTSKIAAPRTRRAPQDRDQIAVLSGRIGAIERHHPEQDTTELRAQVKALRLAEYIKRVVDEAPPLTAKQRAELARILRAPIGGRP